MNLQRNNLLTASCFVAYSQNCPVCMFFWRCGVRGLMKAWEAVNHVAKQQRQKKFTLKHSWVISDETLRLHLFPKPFPACLYREAAGKGTCAVDSCYWQKEGSINLSETFSVAPRETHTWTHTSHRSVILSPKMFHSWAWSLYFIKKKMRPECSPVPQGFPTEGPQSEDSHLRSSPCFPSAPLHLLWSPLCRSWKGRAQVRTLIDPQPGCQCTLTQIFLHMSVNDCENTVSIGFFGNINRFQWVYEFTNTESVKYEDQLCLLFQLP